MKKSLIVVLAILLHQNTTAIPRLIVAQDGSGDYETVQEAVNAVPDNRNIKTEIFIKHGVYKERIIVRESKTNLSLIGEIQSTTVLTFDNYASRLDSAGKPLGTSRTASFYIYASGFTASNITFENSAGPVGQALAIYVAADRAAFFNCRFLGFQDTIYTHGYGSRQYYRNCYIEGTTDFIFGAATALFEECTIFCKKGGMFLSAASTLDTTKYGYVFLRCKVDGNAASNSFYLGRPWRPFAKVAFVYCKLGDIIKSEGWDNWRNPENEKTAFYSEYRNVGPGNRPSDRVSWSRQLTDDQAKQYIPKIILDGWRPSLGK